MTPSMFRLDPFKASIHYAILGLPLGGIFPRKTEVKLLEGTCTTKTGWQHCFPRLLPTGNGGRNGRTVETLQKEKKNPADGGGKEGEEPLIEIQSKTGVNRRAITQWRAPACQSLFTPLKCVSPDHQDMRWFLGSTEFRVLTFDSCGCFSAMDSSQTANSSHVAGAASATGSSEGVGWKDVYFSL